MILKLNKKMIDFFDEKKNMKKYMLDDNTIILTYV